MHLKREVVGLTLVVGVLGTAVDGCSLIVAGPKVQCEADGDCVDELGENHTCLQNRCIRLECHTTQDCVDHYGYEYDPENGKGTLTEKEKAEGAEGTSSIYADMAGFGKPVGATVDANAAGVTPFKPLKVPARICSVGTCVRIRNEGDAECVNDSSGKQLVFGDPNVPNPVVVGFVGDVTRSTSKDTTALFDPKFLQEGDDIRAAALPLSFMRSIMPDVLLVGCSQQRNANYSAQPATEHLLALGAKAIVGPTLSSTFGQAAEVIAASLDAKGNVLRFGTPLFGPWVLGNSAASVRGTDKLLFFPGPFAQDILAPLNALVANREALIRQKKGLTANQPIKVFVYYYSAPPAQNRLGSNFDEYKDLQPLIAQNLKFNGRGAAEQAETIFQSMTSDGQAPATAKVVAAINAMKPDLIIPFAGASDWEAPFVGVEALVKAAADADAAATPPVTVPTFLPQYVHPFIFFESAYASQPYFKDNTFNILSRVTGIRPTRAQAYEAFKKRLKDEFGIGSGELDFKLGLGRAYDASLLLFYSLYAARSPSGTLKLRGPNDFTGREVADALARVTDISVPDTTEFRFDANPGNLNSVISVLTSGKNVKLKGLHATMDFDTVGHTPIVWESWCVDPVDTKRNIPNRSILPDGTLGTDVKCNDPSHKDL